jgi:uncharacterized protein involved in copper resistance
MDERDHDALIELKSAVAHMTTTMAANNIASVERDTRIESAVKAINGTVRGHEAELRMIQRQNKEDDERREQHDEIWTAYKIGRWIGITVATAAVVQSVGIVILLLQG